MNKCSRVQGTLILESMFQYFRNLLTGEDSDSYLFWFTNFFPYSYIIRKYKIIHWIIRKYKILCAYIDFLSLPSIKNCFLFSNLVKNKSYEPFALGFIIFVDYLCIHFKPLFVMCVIFLTSVIFFCHVANRKRTTFWECLYGQRMINYK